VILCNTDENPEKEAMYLRLMEEERVTGVIYSPTHDAAQRFSAQAYDFPVVMIDRPVIGDRIVAATWGIAAAMTRGDISVTGVDPQHLQLVRRAMEGVVNNPKGTAFKARIRKRVMAMGGKTGTVQVRRITKAEREQGIKKNKDLPWKDRDHAMFVAFAPIDAPRYAVAVVVEHGGGGSKVAAPIARDILIKAQQRRSARPGILPKAPGGGRQQVTGPRGYKPGNKLGAKPGARSRDEG